MPVSKKPNSWKDRPRKRKQAVQAQRERKIDLRYCNGCGAPIADYDELLMHLSVSGRCT